LYVYKKTIYEINCEIKKNTNAQFDSITNGFLDIVNNYMNIYKTFIYKIIENDYLSKNLNKNIEVFEKICKKINKTNLNKENIVLLNAIIDKFYFTITDIDYFFETIQEFSKKMKPTHIKKYEKKIYMIEEMREKLNESPEKFVVWLLS